MPRKADNQQARDPATNGSERTKTGLEGWSAIADPGRAMRLVFDQLADAGVFKSTMQRTVEILCGEPDPNSFDEPLDSPLAAMRRMQQLMAHSMAWARPEFNQLPLDERTAFTVLVSTGRVSMLFEDAKVAALRHGVKLRDDTLALILPNPKEGEPVEVRVADAIGREHYVLYPEMLRAMAAEEIETESAGSSEDSEGAHSAGALRLAAEAEEQGAARISLTEAERRVGDYLSTHPSATRTEIYKATKVPTSSIGRTSAWKQAMSRRGSIPSPNPSTRARRIGVGVNASGGTHSAQRRAHETYQDNQDIRLDGHDPELMKKIGSYMKDRSLHNDDEAEIARAVGGGCTAAAVVYWKSSVSEIAGGQDK